MLIGYKHLLDAISGPEESHMIDALSIRNFRCFEKISVEGLGRVNVVVGDNAAGKTSFLEAIFLSQMNSPEIVLRLRLWRGLGAAEVQATRAGYESFWKDLFYRHNTENQIEVNATGSVESTRRLRVYYKEDESVSIQVPLFDDKLAEDTSAIIPITFEVFSNGRSTYYKPEMAPGGFKVKAGAGAAALTSIAAFYASSFAVITSPTEAAHQFSELSKKGVGQKLERIIHQIFPSIKSLSPESDSGIWMLHCNVPELPEKVPIGLVSSGVQKLISILLGIASQRNGIVLIDELDNGFYYKILPKVWEALHRFASEFNVQLFVSTHSEECLRALPPIVRKHEDAFRLIRVERKGKSHLARVFSGKNLRSAIETETEVR